MIDLVCLVADKSLEAAVDALLGRPEALGIRPITHETLVHPQRDPGCFHDGAALLRGFRHRSSHALIVLDRSWDGAPPGDARELEAQLEASLAELDPVDWLAVVVVDPELEVWVFSDSPHVPEVLGWAESPAELRRALERQGLWSRERAKPEDPKRAVEWVLRQSRIPRSSSLFRALASRVGVRGCQDPSFTRLRGLLQGWFPADQVREDSAGDLDR